MTMDNNEKFVENRNCYDGYYIFFFLNKRVSENGCSNNLTIITVFFLRNKRYFNIRHCGVLCAFSPPT